MDSITGNIMTCQSSMIQFGYVEQIRKGAESSLVLDYLAQKISKLVQHTAMEEIPIMTGSLTRKSQAIWKREDLGVAADHLQLTARRRRFLRPYHTIPCHTLPYHTMWHHAILYKIPNQTIPGSCRTAAWGQEATLGAKLDARSLSPPCVSDHWHCEHIIQHWHWHWQHI